VKSLKEIAVELWPVEGEQTNKQTKKWKRSKRATLGENTHCDLDFRPFKIKFCLWDPNRCL
jgi:hypothetical protein